MILDVQKKILFSFTYNQSGSTFGIHVLVVDMQSFFIVFQLPSAERHSGLARLFEKTHEFFE